jgi:four helix bundle protein
MDEPPDIQDRTVNYAMRAVRLYKHLQANRDSAALIIGKQFLRSATSIGANIAEARAGQSRADFIHKCTIAQKEASESKYWITLMLKSELVTKKRIEPLLQETIEILAIISKIIVNARKRP